MIHDLIMSDGCRRRRCSGSANSTPGLPRTLRRCCRRPSSRPGCNRSSKDRFQALTARRPRRLRSSPRQLVPNPAHRCQLRRLQPRPAPAVPRASPYLPDMSMDSKGDVTLGVKPHQLPKPTDLEQRLQAIRSGQVKSPDERIALGLEKPLEEPAAVQSNRAIDVIDQQIQTLSQQMQANPHPLLERRLTELMNTRDMLAQSNAFTPKSTTGQNLFDLQTVQRLGDPYAEQTQRAAATGSSRMPMKTAQGEAGEDVRMLQQGRNMNAGDPQLQDQQAEADAANLGKDVGNAVFQRQGLDSVTSSTARTVTKLKTPRPSTIAKSWRTRRRKPTDIAGLRGDFMQQTRTSTSRATSTGRSSKSCAPAARTPWVTSHSSLRWLRSSTQV